MISFKSFIAAIHDAIMSASDSLMAKNEGILDKYFERITVEEDKDGNKSSREILKPRTVILEYPTLSDPDTARMIEKNNVEGVEEFEGFEKLEVAVPLITLVPLQMSQIEKAVLKADFEIEIVDDEIQLHFTNRKDNGIFKKKRNTTFGRLEITMSPVETSEGLKLVVEGYESMLKRQIT
jgi:hypothetical protein